MASLSQPYLEPANRPFNDQGNAALLVSSPSADNGYSGWRLRHRRVGAALSVVPETPYNPQAGNTIPVVHTSRFRAAFVYAEQAPTLVAPESFTGAAPEPSAMAAFVFLVR